MKKRKSNKPNPMIDTTKQPMIPKGWTIESHKTMGKIKPTFDLFLAEEQKTGYIEGNKLREKLPDNVLNATVLDWLLKNQTYIPDGWKGKYVYFWGTIYRYSDGDRYVLSLYWDGGEWLWDCCWLDGDWDASGPSALLASSALSSRELSPQSLDGKTITIDGITYTLKL